MRYENVSTKFFFKFFNQLDALMWRALQSSDLTIASNTYHIKILTEPYCRGKILAQVRGQNEHNVQVDVLTLIRWADVHLRYRLDHKS